MNAEELAKQISETVFNHYFDTEKRELLERLLIDFAHEIKRSAIEP